MQVHLLIVAATAREAAFLTGHIKKIKPGTPITVNETRGLSVDLLITGPGMVSTTFFLAKALTFKKYDMALNIGICGSFDPAITPVRVVRIKTDQFGDFGAENGKAFLDVFELGLMKKNESPFRNGKLHGSEFRRLACLKAIPSVPGVTVQKALGSEKSCREAYRRYGNVMESMEGAAFFFVCHLEKVPCLQIRAVSNRVEKRNRNKWKIKEAINALAGFTGLLLLELETLNP